MELFINEVKILTRKPTDIKMTLIGDLHGYYRSKGFNKVIDGINSLDSDMLLVAGDICQGKTWQDPENLKILENVFRALAENKKPIFMIVGNHDLSKFNDIAYQNYKSLANIDYVHPLYNENIDYKIGDETAHISGLVTNKGDYVTAGGNLMTKLKHEQDEREYRIAGNIRDLKNDSPLKDDEFNILLSHDPRQTRMDEVYREAKDYDMITGAHVHNGYMPNAITGKNDILLDNDWLGVATAGNAKQRTYTRGTIYGTENFHVQQLPTGEWFLVENEKATRITEEQAKEIILNHNYYSKNNFTPTVITGGVNKYNVLPIDSAEITQIESSVKRH